MRMDRGRRGAYGCVITAMLVVERFPGSCGKDSALTRYAPRWIRFLPFEIVSRILPYEIRLT